MFKTAIILAVGAAFGMSRYGAPTKAKIKKIFTIKEEIIKFGDDDHGIRCTWAGITFYRNLEYTGKDPSEKWMFKSDGEFSRKCKGSLEDCRRVVNETDDEETVVSSTDD
jgi:hypothetical protein